MTRMVRISPALTGAALLLVVLGTVIEGHYLQIEWQTSTAVPVAWWYAAEVAGVVAVPLFLTAVGLGLGGPAGVLRTRVAPNLAWHAVSVFATLVVLWRFGPVYGLPPVRDLPELLLLLLLPPTALALTYALAVFPLLAWAVRGLPGPLVVTAAVALAVAAGVAATRDPFWVTAAELTRNLVFFLAGWRLAATATAPPATGALAAVGRAAAPIAAVLLPVTAAVGGVLVRRLSVVDGLLQMIVAVVEPVLVVVLVVAAGLIAHRLLRLGRVALVATLSLTSVACTAEPGFREPEVVIAFGGDVHFEGRVQRLLTDPGSAFGPAGPLLSAADLAFVNLETPITGRDEPEPKRYVFRADPAAATALDAAGIDAVSLANNHAMDHGRAGLTDTITAARAAGVGVFGAGQDVDEAFRPWRTEVRGIRVAVFGFSQVDDLADSWTAGPDRAGMAMAFDTDRAVRAVAAARMNSDLVVVMPHWGVEGDQCPSREQQEFARRLSDAGADIVVGAHAHVLQGAGRLGPTFVAYGLGNLLWYSSGLYPPFSARSGILTLTVRGRTVVRSDFAPILTSDSGRPQLLTGARADMAGENYAALTRCAELSDPGPGRLENFRIG